MQNIKDLLVTKKELLIFKKFLNEKSKIAIISHIFPDPDAITSALVLYKIYKQYNNVNKNIKIFIEGTPIGNLKHIPRVNQISFTDNIFNSLTTFNPNTIILTDINHYNRLTLKNYNNLEKFIKQKRIYIFDHHQTKGIQTTYSVQKPYISTTELIYKLSLKANISLTPTINTLLAIGMLSDSNLFLDLQTSKYNQVQFLTNLQHIVQNASLSLQQISHISELLISHKMYKYINTLINNLVITKNISYTYGNFKLTNNKNMIYINKSVVFLMLKILRYTKSKIKFILYQINNTCFFSIRSQKINITQIANHFGGGGHKHAAGAKFNCTSNTEFNYYKKAILNYTKKILKLNNN